MKDIIKVVNVSKYLGGVKILDNITFEVKRSERLLIIGPSRSGKTTLIRTLLNIYNRDSGYIELFGRDPNIDRVEALRKVGYIPQKLSIPKDIYLLDIFKLRCSLLNISLEKGLENIEEILGETRINRILNMKGMKADRRSRKKFYLAMALLGEPSVIVIDGLMEFIDRDILTILSRILSPGITFIATSRGYEMRLEFDRLLRLENGRIIG